MEATRLWAKRVMLSTTIPRSVCPNPAPPTSCFFFSSASYQRAAAQGSSAGETGTEHHRDSMYEGPVGSGAKSYGADTAKQGVKKATEMAENVGDTVKEMVDGAWKVAKQAAEGVKEAEDDGGDRIEEDATVNEIKKVEQPVDTYEYRSIEELREKGAGYDLVDDDNKT